MEYTQFNQVIKVLIENQNRLASQAKSLDESKAIRNEWNIIRKDLVELYNNAETCHIYEPFNDLLKTKPEDIDSDYIKTFLGNLFSFKKIKNVDFKIIDNEKEKFLDLSILPTNDDHTKLNRLLAIQNVINREITNLINKKLDQES